MLGIWERPPKARDWEVPELEVTAFVDAAFETWDVWRLYGDPHYWETTLAEWASRHGDKRVLQWDTRRTRAMALAIRAFAQAIEAGDVSHDGDPTLARHIGNAQKRDSNLIDEERKPLFTISKERDDSPHKIDGAAAAVLSWRARLDALAAGALEQQVVLEGSLMR